MVKNLTPDKQLQVIDRLFDRFRFNYDSEKYRVWEQDNAKLTWAQFLGDATLDDIKEALTKALEIEYIYELPTATEFAALCKIKPAEAPAPIIDGVDTGTVEIFTPALAKQAHDPPPQGIGWAKKLWQRQQAGEKLPVDSICMMRYALRLGD
jgi:hypothetical protein